MFGLDVNHDCIFNLLEIHTIERCSLLLWKDSLNSDAQQFHKCHKTNNHLSR